MLRGLWTLIVAVTTTLVLGLVAIAGNLIRRQSDITMRLGKVWSHAILRALGVRPEYRGLDHLAATPNCVLIANHQSMVDILALIPVLPVRARFVAKRELFRVPVFGWALAASGMVPIDRHNRGRAIGSLDRAGREIRAGRPFVLFAEGTRSRDGRLGPFKKGAFHVALQTRATVLPVAISGAWGVLRPRSLRVCPGPVRVTVGAPIDIRPFLPDDLEGLRAAVRAVIAANLEPDELGAEDAALRAEAR